MDENFIEEFYFGVTKQMIEYANLFYKEVSSNDFFKLLIFNDCKLEEFRVQFYRQNFKMIKNMKAKLLPDRHKVIAAALKSFIQLEVFKFDIDKYLKLKKENKFEDKKINICIVIPNEMYIIDMIKFFLNYYNSKFKNMPNYTLVYPNCIYNYYTKSCHSYISDFIHLLRGYMHNKLEIAVQELAHILFFLEMGYEIKEFNADNKYYQ